jgi:hypothetical protein
LLFASGSSRYHRAHNQYFALRIVATRVLQLLSRNVVLFGPKDTHSLWALLGFTGFSSNIRGGLWSRVCFVEREHANNPMPEFIDRRASSQAYLPLF